MNFKMKPTISFARVLMVLQDHGVKVVRILFFYLCGFTYVLVYFYIYSRNNKAPVSSH